MERDVKSNSCAQGVRGAYIDGRAQLPSSDDSYDAWDSFGPAGSEPVLAKVQPNKDVGVLPAKAPSLWEPTEGTGSDTWSMDLRGSSCTSEWHGGKDLCISCWLHFAVMP